MFRRLYPGRSITELDIDTREGAAEASLYGVMRYPTVLILAADGSVIQSWDGQLPRVDEVAVYLVHEPSFT